MDSNGLLDGVPPVGFPGLSPFGPPGNFIMPGEMPIPPGWQYYRNMPPRFAPDFDVFSRPEFMSPAQAGIASAQVPPIFPMDRAWGALANQGVAQLVGALTGDQGIAQGMYPWQGTGGMSQFDWFSARMRGVEAEQLLKGRQGTPGLYAINPELGLVGNFGHLAPIQQMMGGDIREAFSIGFGQLGTQFTGGIREQGENVARFLSALTGGFTSGNELDDVLMFGSSLPETVSNIAAATHAGFFGFRGGNIQQISDAVRRGETDFARGMARDMGRGVNEFAAAGRELFGGDASIQDIFSGVGEIMNMRGMSVSEATGRLREIDALGEVLNVDSQVLTKYAAAMRRLSENAGIYGSTQTDAMTANLLGAEAMTRASAANGVDVSKDSLIRHRQNVMAEDLTSFNARRNQAMQTILYQTPEERLVGMGGPGGSLLAARGRMQQIIDNMDGVTDPAALQAMHRELGQIYNALPPDLKGAVAKEIAYGNPENQAAMLAIQGVRSYNEGASGAISAATLDAAQGGFAAAARNLQGRRGFAGLSRRLGGMRGIVNQMGESGLLGALMSVTEGGGTTQYNRIRDEFAAQFGVSGDLVNDILQNVVQGFGDRLVIDPKTQRERSDSEVAYRLMRLSGVGNEQIAGLRNELDTVDVSKQIFTAIAGDAFRGNKRFSDLMVDTIKGVLSDPEAQRAAEAGDWQRVAGLALKNAPDEFINELTKGGRASRIREIMAGGDVGGRTVFDLREQIQGLKAKHGENYDAYVRERDKLIGAFIEDMGGEEVGPGAANLDAARRVGRHIGAKIDGGEIELGNKTIDGMRGAFAGALEDFYKMLEGMRGGNPLVPQAEALEGK